MVKKWHNQTENPTLKTELGRSKITINYNVLILGKHIVSRVSCYFQNVSNQGLRLSVLILKFTPNKDTLSQE